MEKNRIKNGLAAMILSGLIGGLFTGCAGGPIPIVRPADVSTSKHEVHAMEELAMAHADGGGFKKCASLEKNAAKQYGLMGDHNSEALALARKASCEIWFDREAFMETAEELTGFYGYFNMPSDQEAFLINLKDRMKGQPLTYPPKIGKILLNRKAR